MTHRFSYLVLLMLPSLMVCACQPHDPFCFHHLHGAVVVEYDWSQSPDATEIRGTRCSFYHCEDGSHAATANFSGMEGGSLYLSEGEYDVISYNSDTDKIHWRGSDTLNTLEAYTRDASLTEDLPGFGYEKIDGLVLTPNRLWIGHKERIYVSGNDTTTIRMVPAKATYEVIWEVTGIKGADRVKACAVSVTDVGGSLFPVDLHTGRDSSLMSGVGRRINVKTKGGEATGGFHGAFEIFGCDFQEDCRHSFTIYCWSGGGNIKASYDVTDQFHIVEEDRKIYITIEADFEIPVGGSSGAGGFIPEVDNWGAIHEDIIL